MHCATKHKSWKADQGEVQEEHARTPAVLSKNWKNNLLFLSVAKADLLCLSRLRRRLR